MSSPTYLGHSITSNLGFPDSSAGEESVFNAGDPQFNSWVGKIPWRRDSLPSIVCLGFHGGSDDKESACNMRDLGSIPGLRKSPGGGHGNPFQYSCLENPHGQSSLAGYSPWGCKESYMTEKLSTARNKPMCQSRFRNMYLIVNWQVYLTLTWHSPYQEVILKVWVSNAITRCWCKNLFSLKAPRIYGDNWTASVLLLNINKSHLLSSKQIREPI